MTTMLDLIRAVLSAALCCIAVALLLACFGCGPLKMEGTQKVDGRIRHDVDVSIGLKGRKARRHPAPERGTEAPAKKGCCGCNPCKCEDCRCFHQFALPSPNTPLATVRIHDGEAFIAWIDEIGRRQERMMTEEEFWQLAHGEK